MCTVTTCTGGTLGIRRFGVAAAAAVAAGALMLSGCAAPQSEIVEGSTLSVAWNQPFYSYNGNTSYGNATANNNITYATNAQFNYYNEVPELVKDESFGTYELVSEDPMVVKYTINDGVKWSDGTPVDGVDLHAALGGALGCLQHPGLRRERVHGPRHRVSSRDDFPTDVVFFDSGSDPTSGAGLVQDLPEISDDHRTVTMTWSKPFVDWEYIFTNVGLPGARGGHARSRRG